MSDSQKDQAEQNGAEAEGNEGNGGNEGARQKVDRRTFATADEAKAAGAVVKSQKLYQVTIPGGETAFVWARRFDQAMETVALARGWTVAGVTDATDKAAAALEALTPEQRAALLARFAPAPEPAKEPAPAKGKGKK
jgi:hypothetical protein